MADEVLETRNISKSFGALAANQDISLKLKAGEIHAVIGPNGAGKSTLIKQICGGIAPDSGSVYLNGEDVTSQSTQQRARLGIGRTFQISALAMQDTVLQNAVLGVLGVSGKQPGFFSNILRNSNFVDPAMAALERVGLAQKTDVKTAELSHGERRELEVAVALTLVPKVFVMDEPMAGLGSEGTARMTGLLDKLRVEAPILLVEHDMDAVFNLADRISVLDYGRLIATGTVEEIRNNPKVQEAYLGDAP